MLVLHLAFAGIWHLLVDYLGMFAFAAVLIVGSFFVDEVPFLGKVSADMRWVAAGIIACLLWGAHIQHDDDLRWEAKQAVLDKAVERVVGQTAPKPNAKHTAPRDRWDRPGN